MKGSHGREGSLRLVEKAAQRRETAISNEIQARTSGMAHGGSAIARIDGKAFFVDGALPGELLSGTIEVDKGSWGRILLDQILEPSPERVTPQCVHFDDCGGCQWQQGSYPAQLEWKRSIVAGQLAHLGRHPDPPVQPTVAPGPAYGYRNRMDYRVTAGRPALYARRSKQLVPLHECQILHPNLMALFVDLGDLSDVTAITLRTATTTGATMAIITGEVPRQASSWGCSVALVSNNELFAVHGDPVLEETVADIPFRITGTSFFQNNTAGAEELVRLVAAAADLGPDDTLLDAYAGGGLFAAAVGRDAGRVLAIEVDELSAHDLQANLNRAGIDEFRILRAATEDAIERIDEYWDVAVVDPPRRGLGSGGVDAVTAASPRTIVYVSCDPASLARDTVLLADHGYQLTLATPVDMFPHTFHVETVARFMRAT
jgi:23S rRNA (uracil1939-C5)-methyltransferase